MVDSVKTLFSTDSFMPYGHCFLWRPEMLWLHVTSDALITLAYFSIPFTRVHPIRRRRHLELNWMFVCSAVFVMAGAAVHLMEMKLIPDALREPSLSAPQCVDVDLEQKHFRAQAGA